MKSNLLKYFIYTIFLSTLIFNLYFFLSPPNNSTPFSFSSGDSYYKKLNLWFFYAKKQDWYNAAKIEPQLDLIDITDYKSTHHPDKIKQIINKIAIKTDKSTEDWLEIAKLQLQINQKQSAIESLKLARQLDPVRNDIEHFYFQLTSTN